MMRARYRSSSSERKDFLAEQQDYSPASSGKKAEVGIADSVRVLEASQEFETGVRFLLAEYELLRGFTEQDNAITTKRIEVLLTLTTAFAAGLALLSQTHINYQTLLITILISSLALLVIGWTTFRVAIKRDITVVSYIRAINRIRAYFVENASEIDSYILMRTDHEYPKYARRIVSGYALNAVVVNSLLAGVCVAIMIMLGQHLTSPDFISILAASISVLIAFELQRRYAKKLYNQEEKETKARNGKKLSPLREAGILPEKGQDTL